MNIERGRERLKRHEAVIPWMYLDTTEHVTVGCGRCLETAEEAKSLPFVDRLTRAPATHDAIEQGFRNVEAAPPDRLARFYRALSTVDLLDGLMHRESLVAAAKRGDWESVATLSDRRQVSEERNQEIAALFRTEEAQA
jgi:hypothetical protein